MLLSRALLFALAPHVRRTKWEISVLLELLFLRAVVYGARKARPPLSSALSSDLDELSLCRPMRARTTSRLTGRRRRQLVAALD